MTQSKAVIVSLGTHLVLIYFLKDGLASFNVRDPCTVSATEREIYHQRKNANLFNRLSSMVIYPVQLMKERTKERKNGKSLV